MFTNHILSNLKAEKNPKDRFQTARTKLIIGFNITLILWIVPEYTKKLHSMQKCVGSLLSLMPLNKQNVALTTILHYGTCILIIT